MVYINTHITHIVTYTHTLLSCADVLNTTVVAIVCIILCVYSVYSCRGFWPTMPTVVCTLLWLCGSIKCRGIPLTNKGLGCGCDCMSVVLDNVVLCGMYLYVYSYTTLSLQNSILNTTARIYSLN